MMTKARWGLVVLATSAVGLAVACSSSSGDDDGASGTDAGNDVDIDTGTISPPTVDAGVDSGPALYGVVAYGQTFGPDGGGQSADVFAAFGNPAALLADCKYRSLDVTYPAAKTSGCTIEICSNPSDAGVPTGSKAIPGPITLTGAQIADGGFTLSPSSSKMYQYTSIQYPLWAPGDTTLAVHAPGADFPGFEVDGFVGPSPLTSLTVGGSSALTESVSFSRAADLSIAFAGASSGATTALQFETVVSAGTFANLSCAFTANSLSLVIDKADLSILGSTGTFSYGTFSRKTVTPDGATVDVVFEVDGPINQTLTITN